MSFRREGAAIVLVIVLAAAAPAAVERASPDRYIRDVRALASTKMEGRGAGTSGLSRAAGYIEQQFRAAGLQPVGVGGSYRQPFAVTTGARLRGENTLAVRPGARGRKLRLKQDYIPLSFSANGSVTAPVVFAGYGVSADEFNYEDYLHLDVKDKIVVLLRYEPPSFAEKNNKQRTHHAHLVTKAINARNHGARAVVLVNGKLEGKEEDALLRFGTLAGPEDAGILMVQAKNAAVDEWLRAAGKSLAEVQAGMDKSAQAQSFALPAELQVTVVVDIERTRATVENVVGYLPGRTDEYVVVGAHYDHLGRGNASSLAPSEIGKVHPGADDNASGASGLLEMVRLFAGERGLERGILFAAFAGEEIGLLGSSTWVKEPALPLDRAVAMLNLDMIGRIKERKVYVGGVGTGSTFKGMLDELGGQHKFTLAMSPGGYSASDHTSFVSKGVPVLFFFSGLHSDYHKPSDTWEKIRAKDAAELLDLVAGVTARLAAGEERPTFIKVEEPRPAGGGGAPGYGPYFGSIPDFGEVETGVKFADVRPGSPAAKAGLKPGDILVEFGGKPIKNLYDFTDALRRSKVGDVVEVKVLRGDKTVAAKVTLEQRK